MNQLQQVKFVSSTAGWTEAKAYAVAIAVSGIQLRQKVHIHTIFMQFS